MSAEGAESIRMVTWLAPGLPLALFEEVRGGLEVALGVPVSLESRTKLSGPEVGSRDPFALAQAEVGFLCAPAAVPPSVREQGGFELLGLAPLFDDPRYADQPRCFCDLVLRQDHPAETLDDLRGVCFGYNDASSLSGWLGLAWELGHRQETPESFFGRLVQTGGHQSSLAALRDGGIDVASIDSNVLRTHPGSLTGLKVVASVGPWPSQPVVVRASLSPERKARVREALSALGPWPQWGFVGFRAQAGPELDAVPPAAG